MNHPIQARRKTLTALLLFALAAILCFAPLTSHAASPTSVSIMTNQSSYPTGTETITVSGNVTPAPTVSGTYVAVSIIGPNGAMVDANQFAVSSATGAFNGTFVTGGPTYNLQGAYTIKAVYENASNSAMFQYGTSTTTSSSQSAGSTTTITTGITTTETSQVQTTVTQPGPATTVTQTSQVETTVTSQSNVVTTVSSGSSSTALAIGAVGVIIAVIAAVMAVMAMRRK